MSSLLAFVYGASRTQRRAWGESLHLLQRELAVSVRRYQPAQDYTVILEYELPRDVRRPDVIVIGNGGVVVLELKGKICPARADVDQTLAYARDLRCYHAACAERPVHAVLVLTRASSLRQEVDGVTVVSPDQVGGLLIERTQWSPSPPLSPEMFLDEYAYAPLPALVHAARDLFAHRSLPQIKRASAATDSAVERITAIAYEAAQTKTRRLVLVTGVPGAGKTLVGLRLVHAGCLDDLIAGRPNGRRSSPAVFLSGNGPLVQVLQDALREAGGGGRTFVQDVKSYVKTYGTKGRAVPPEHIVVFDEAQRAWDAQQVAYKHAYGRTQARSEPEHFIEFAERIPEWCVVIGLIGIGQEIHIGEEGGLSQWRQAVENARNPTWWRVHLPPTVGSVFASSLLSTAVEPALDLNTEIRYHRASRVHDFVEAVLAPATADEAALIAETLYQDGHRYLLTRNLAVAKAYARERYADAPHARYGILASSKDRDLVRYGVDNTFQTTRRLRVGKWYNLSAPASGSCCALDCVATEFAAQGLELDLALVAWGTDFARCAGRWSIERARGTRGLVHDPFRLRHNVYRVLLTRGRDGTLIFVPPDPFLDETFDYLRTAGIKMLA